MVGSYSEHKSDKPEVLANAPFGTQAFSKFLAVFIGIYLIFSLMNLIGAESPTYRWVLVGIGSMATLISVGLWHFEKPRYMHGVLFAIGWACPFILGGLSSFVDKLGLPFSAILLPISLLILVLILPLVSKRYFEWLDDLFDPRRPQNPALLRLAGVAGVLGAMIGMNARKWFGETFAHIFSATLSLVLATGLMMIAGFAFWKYFPISPSKKH